VDVGERTEATILAELVRRGHRVLIPFGTNHRYDMVIELEGTFIRIQRKTGRLRQGAVRFNTMSVQSNTRRHLTRTYKGEADVFLVYCPDTNRIYAVPVADTPTCHMDLRVDPPRNCQVRGVRWAKDYELPA
jgi:hypothetical protein